MEPKRLPPRGAELTSPAVISHPSPNFGPRRDGARPSLIVLHYTAMASAAAALERLCDPLAEVSAHYLIGRDGQVWQLVDEGQRAWHAGAGEWAGQGDVNSRSIGIELDNGGDQPFSAPLMDRLEWLLGEVMARHAIPPEGVIAHSDMAPGRKQDPGPRFDWQRLARADLAVWPQAARAGLDPEQFRADAMAFGYPDLPDEDLRDAVRLRFRPSARHDLDAVDCAMMRDLANRFAPAAVSGQIHPPTNAS